MAVKSLLFHMGYCCRKPSENTLLLSNIQNWTKAFQHAATLLYTGERWPSSDTGWAMNGVSASGWSHGCYESLSRVTTGCPDAGSLWAILQCRSSERWRQASRGRMPGAVWEGDCCGTGMCTFFPQSRCSHFRSLVLSFVYHVRWRSENFWNS